MKIISEAEHEVSVSFSHNFGQPNKYGEIELCFGFDCTESGKPKQTWQTVSRAKMESFLWAFIVSLIPIIIRQWANVFTVRNMFHSVILPIPATVAQIIT
jgi:hypothetical protein